MFCRFCGKTVLNDSVFCAYCGKKLIETADDCNSSFDYSSLDGVLNVNKEYQSKLDKARAFVITEKYQQAMEIYTKMIDDDPTDINGYIGCVRVSSKNYTDFNSTFNFKNADNSWTYFYASKAFETVKKLLNGTGTNDKEFEDYAQRYKEYLAKQEKARLEQEKARLEQEKKRQEELERQKREKEEAEKRKPDEFKKAILLGDNAIRQNNLEEAFKSYVIALRLANEIQATLPESFIENLSAACTGYESTARNNSDIMNYVTPLAENNNPTAQCLLGRIYYKGGSEEYMADRWYKAAANQGVPEAFCYLGDKHNRSAERISYNESNYLEKRKEIYLQAYYWYKKAFDKNYLPSIERVALYHRRGNGVERNTNYALELYKKINKYYDIASIYHYDLRDPLEAVFWYKKDNRNLEIAEIYEKLGRKSEAIEYYKRCVENVPYPSERAEKALARLLYGN